MHQLHLQVGSVGQAVRRARRHGFMRGMLPLVAGLAVAAALLVAADYGITPAQAATAEGFAAASSTPASASDAPISDGRASSSSANTQSAHLDAASGSRAIGPDPGRGFIRLPGHVLDALAKATVDDAPIGSSASPEGARHDLLTLTLTLKRDDQKGFDRYLNDVYDPRSKNFRHFLTQRQIAQRFGPSRQGYSQVLAYLHRQGFRLIEGAKNRLTVTVRGSRAKVERAFALNIDDYELNGTAFFANNWDPALPQNLASRVFAIDGLSSLSLPQPAFLKVPISNAACGTNGGSVAVAAKQQPCKNLVSAVIDLGAAYGCLLQFVSGPYLLEIAAITNYICAIESMVLGYGNVVSANAAFKSPHTLRAAVSASEKTAQARASTTPDGSGQTIGLVEFDTFNTSDVSDYLALTGAPSTQIGNLSRVPVNGGVASPGSGEAEVLLDIDTIMTQAPGAKVVVYDAPFGGQATSYTAVFNAMINNGVTVISNSWASCEDQVSQAEAQSIDMVLQSAAASGISVFNGSGDSGSTCLDGSASTISVPADSPHATAVGGTSLQFGPGYTYGSETWWDGTTSIPATGQGGFGVSRYFSQPSYQAGLGGSSMRSIPDVVVLADPADGALICQADDGGCPSGTLNGGSSLAAPEWAAFAALINQTQGKNLGSFNTSLYPLAATDAFHRASSMGSDFAHVGLGSPNLNVLNRLLSGQTVGQPAANMSVVTTLVQLGTVTVLADHSFNVPADGTSEGGVLVNLVDANGHTVSGKTVTLTANGGNAVISPASGVSSVSNGAVAFSITDLTAETLTLTAADTTDGIVLPQVSLVFGVPSAASAGISVTPSAVPADGQSAATIIVTLKDALNRPSPGKTVAISDAGAHAVITGPTPAVTDANGQIQFSATDQVDETVTFSAVDVSDANLPIPGSGTVTYSGSTTTACGFGTVPVAGAGYAITPYITGLSASTYVAPITCPPGANDPAFTSTGTVLATDYVTGAIYQTSLAGGAVSSANILSTVNPVPSSAAALGGLVYGKDGSAYATLGSQPGSIVQIDPTTGAQLRVVASGLTCPAALSVDPLSGDLFFDDECTGGGTDNASIFRVIDPANTNAGSPTSVVVYASLPSTPNGGMAFAPNGTLYAVSGYYYVSDAPVEQISATNSATVTVAPVTGVTSNYGLAMGSANTDGSAQSLIVGSSSGMLSEVPITSPSTPNVLVSANAPGPGVTGPDGCMYVAAQGTIYKISSSTGSCTFAPTSPAPSIALLPAAVSPNPAQGASETFTATLKNVGTPSGVPVFFQIGGANAQFKLVDTDANGIATLTYTAAQSGVDTVVATTAVGSTALISNKAQVTWTAGKHVAFVSLNSSPQGGTVNTPVNVVASLTDASASPMVSLSGQSITFTLGASSCTAATNSSGTASCSLMPSTPGTETLTASFAGTSSFAAAKQSEGFNVTGIPTPAPTVTISVSPTTIAAGGSSTLTWSSTNATACTAGGSWSGSEATNGTQSVTPPANGSYSYTLSCTGAGGTGTATAVLSATLVAVTVTAKSGGGAMSWYVLLALALLVVLRLKVARSARSVAGAPRRRDGSPWVGVSALFLVLACVVPRLAHADSTAGTSESAAADQPTTAAEPYYIGFRVGSMPLRQDSSKIDQGLAALGFPGITASSDIAGAAGTVFAGYSFTAHAAIELGYTYRDSTTAHLAGTIPSSSRLTPLLQDTAELTRGYGNIVSLSYSGRFEVLPRFSLEPRLGGFFWATKATAISLDDRIDTTHEGGGVTAGATAAYRLARGLELGVSVDHFRGFPNNIATLYAGSLIWRFGP